MTFLYVLVPQALLTALQAAAGAFFFEKQHVFLKNVCYFFNMLCFYLFGKTSNRRGTQSCAGKWSIVVLSSHLDPIGEQNDVQYLSISCQY